eukprot:CAMPEP_0169428840 /NCGR_PEP_ID=MMETSP1042-20121227/1545_1 /TAXON_ID=464988 /ORGANISM="Hemiselmis andersenii, Strain CCMP1180" /LENGTH=284 /DNA_ID=CAMNT_0009539045 /DNA_START=27 /DNA_END=880 /DNA_ORIENTATION=-
MSKIMHKTVGIPTGSKSKSLNYCRHSKALKNRHREAVYCTPCGKTSLAHRPRKRHEGRPLPHDWGSTPFATGVSHSPAKGKDKHPSATPPRPRAAPTRGAFPPPESLPPARSAQNLSARSGAPTAPTSAPPPPSSRPRGGAAAATAPRWGGAASPPDESNLNFDMGFEITLARGEDLRCPLCSRMVSAAVGCAPPPAAPAGACPPAPAFGVRGGSSSVMETFQCGSDTSTRDSPPPAAPRALPGTGGSPTTPAGGAIFGMGVIGRSDEAQAIGFEEGVSGALGE